MCNHAKQEHSGDKGGNDKDSQGDQDSSPELKPTLEKPNPVFVNEKDSRAETRNEKASGSNRWWEGLTPLFWATILLAIATAFLVCFTRKLANAALRQNRALHRQNSLLRREVEAQHRQNVLLKRQNELSEKQHELRRTIFYTENRPRIRVRRLVIGGIEKIDSALLVRQEHILFDEGGPRGFIELYNAGNSPGTPTQAYVQAFVTRNLREPLIQPWKDTQAETIRVGGSYKIEFGPEKWLPEFEYRGVIHRPEASVYLIAAFRYKDMLGNEITTEFRYRFNAKTAQFECIK